MMDENTTKNIHHKSKLKYLIRDEILASQAPKTDEDLSDLWTDVLNLRSSVQNRANKYKADKDISFSTFPYDKNNDEIKDNWIDLYNDLEKIEEENCKLKQQHETEYENCKKELEKFRELDVKNRARIEELTKVNSNLQRSICSLYRSFKREIEFKDELLNQANAENARIKYRMAEKNEEILKNAKKPNSENNSTEKENSRKRKFGHYNIPNLTHDNPKTVSQSEHKEDKGSRQSSEATRHYGKLSSNSDRVRLTANRLKYDGSRLKQLKQSKEEKFIQRKYSNPLQTWNKGVFSRSEKRRFRNKVLRRNQKNFLSSSNSEPIANVPRKDKSVHHGY